jgi:hypothetical protein
MGRIAELEKLEALLRKLWGDYSEIEAPTGENKRLAVFLSLEAVIEFLEARPDGRRMSFALAMMMAALADVESGRKVDWLSNTAQHRAEGAPEAVAMLRGRCAAIMHAMMEKRGFGRPQAAKAVFRDIPHDSPVFDGTKRTWRTVAGWRDDVIGSAEPSGERESFRAMLALIERRPDLLDFLRKVPV